MISIKILYTCVISIKQLFNNHNRNTRISPNYNIDTSNINTRDDDYVIIINPQNIITLGKISD